jgi:CheY-like chemotaxis protein
MTSSERTQPLVLVVEDYQDARELYVQYFRLSGFDVAEARNGVEALERAAELLPDIILMDLALPQIDGWEVTRRLKRDCRTRQIPVLALTGHALQSHAEVARQAGCDGFVTKPCLPDDLVVEMRRLIEDPNRGGAGAAAQNRTRTGPAAS